MADIKITYEGHELFVDEAEFFKILVSQIVNAYELVLMLYMSIKMREDAKQGTYEEMTDFVLKGFDEIKKIAIGTVNDKIDRFFEDYETILLQFTSIVLYLKNKDNGSEYESELKRLRELDANMYKLINDLLTYIRSIREEKGILEESLSMDEERFYNKGEIP